jgi:hypothetical protein
MTRKELGGKRKELFPVLFVIPLFFEKFKTSFLLFIRSICFYFLLFTFYFLLSPVSAQSLTIETGLGYVEQSSGYIDYLKLGTRVMFPVSEAVDLYVAPYWLGGFNVDAGVWFRLPLTIQDLEGFRSYVGTGLSLTQARFGFALSAALSYDLSDNTALMLTYTHRPLITPGLSQAFDVSLGINFKLY